MDMKTTPTHKYLHACSQAALFVIVTNWEQPRSLSVND